jgi:uncharacterized BrkB/YihY/UPF0761 family membrane protein
MRTLLSIFPLFVFAFSALPFCFFAVQRTVLFRLCFSARKKKEKQKVCEQAFDNIKF